MTKKKQKTDWRIICVGMVCLTAAEIFALSQGINGTIFAIFVAVIAGTIGVTIPTPNILKK